VRAMLRLLLPLAVLGAACGTAGTKALSVEAGGACTTENAGACVTGTRLLVCQNMVWVVATDCKGPDGCRVINEAVECDLRGNTIGDLCPGTSEGKVRCDPDGGVNILRCRSRVLELEFACPSTTMCGLYDAGLTCR